MSVKMEMNNRFKNICEIENEINMSWYWKFQSKTLKTMLLDLAATNKSAISIFTKQIDCLQNIVENS